MGLGADNFSTFLSTLSKGLSSSTGETVPSPREPNRMTDAALELLNANAEALKKLLGQAPTPLTPTDAILAKLAGAEQGLPISALVVPPLVSPGAAIEAVKEMQSFGLVQLADGLVHLTAEGQKASRQLTATPGQ